MVRTPGEIFTYMSSNKIGEKSALFWMSWAFVAEKNENFNLTDQIFQKGIRKNAEPKDVSKYAFIVCRILVCPNHYVQLWLM